MWTGYGFKSTEIEIVYHKWYAAMVEPFKRVPAKFYRNILGKEPVREWLLSLNKEDRVNIGTDIQTAEFGWPIGMPICRPLKQGLHEVRTKLSDGRISRVLFCVYSDNMILLHGFIKKTRTIPKQDLSLANKRKKEVENG